ncbi:hypothetical protein EON64_13725 [archaeon]|nr:MAG: hypothetical protein EON64_13725 [archaeon]
MCAGWISENGLRTGTWTQNDASNVYNATITPVFNSTTNITTYTNTTVLLSGAKDMPSAFSNFYALQNIDAVQKVFGTVFPIVLYIVMGLVLLNIFNRLLILLKLDNYQFGQGGRIVITSIHLYSSYIFTHLQPS